jgi:mannose-6-phosphate isomerase-like protein (cupin superfamily)
LQRHQFRGEHWVVVQGQAMVTIGNDQREVSLGQNAIIAQGVIHRIANPGNDNLIIIEIQHGQRLDENDIERFEDDYGRIAKTPNVLEVSLTTGKVNNG